MPSCYAIIYPHSNFALNLHFLSTCQIQTLCSSRSVQRIRRREEQWHWNEPQGSAEMGIRSRSTPADCTSYYCDSGSSQQIISINSRSDAERKMSKLKQKNSVSSGLDEKRSFALRVFLGLLVICIWAICYRSSPSCGDDCEDIHPTITIFSAPMPLKSFSDNLLDLMKERQELAVRSWLALAPYVSVVLFGQHPSIIAFAESLGPQVSVETGIDFSFVGTPFFHSMIHKMRTYDSDIYVLVDPDIVILPDFVTALHSAYKLDPDWLLITASPNISNFPYHLDTTGRYWLHKNGENINSNKDFLMGGKHGGNCHKKVLFAWNRGSAPLHAGVLPPFLYQKGLHNQWLINEASLSGFRLLIDASGTVSSFFPERLDYLSKYSVSPEEGDNMDSWESKSNSYLASKYGSFYFQNDRDLTNVARLVNRGGKYIYINSSESEVYPFQLPKVLNKAGSLKRDLLHSVAHNWRSSTGKIYSSRNNCSIIKMPKTDLNVPTQFILSFSLESLLELVADEHRTVILAIAGESYKDMLMSWVCRLRRLSIRNFLVSALDMETYEFSMIQGLPVFKDSLAPSNISFDGCHFGSDCFQRVTKVKSRLVLQILKLGYNVLLSDVDVFWFRNPLPYLRSFGPAVLLAQSDEYNKTGPINLPRRLNSGFYFARSDMPTISAIEKVVKHASVSGLSEQPSFYDVLCGEGGIYRISQDRCFEPETNLTVHFLDRNLFANGAFQGFWENHHVRSACRKKGCMILHNNWISGRQRKLERQVRSGLFAYSPTMRTCLQSLHVEVHEGTNHRNVLLTSTD